MARRHRPHMPGWVRATLDAEVTFALARLLLTLPYWCSGLAKLLDPLGAVQECAGLGLPTPGLVVALTIVVQLGGSLLVIANRRLWLGAGALAVFTVAATLAAHAFWRVQGAARLAQMNAFLEHLALIAAFALAAVASRRRRHGAFRAEYLP